MDVSKRIALGFGLLLIGCEQNGDSIPWSESVLGVVPGLAATLGSENFPRYMSPGETIGVSVTMHNEGTTTWTSNMCLRTLGIAPSSWGTLMVCVPASTIVQSGEDFTFNFNITAINTPGTVSHTWQMVRRAPNTLFGPLIQIPVSLQAGGGFNAQYAFQSIPSHLNTGASATFNVSFFNNGPRDWSTRASNTLGSQNTPNNVWGMTSVALSPVPNDIVLPNGTHNFSFNVTTPTTEGLYFTDWRMRQTGTNSAGNFGDHSAAQCVEVSTCGNNVTTFGEECDDGNAISGDGCTACVVDRRAIDLATAPIERAFIGPFSARELGNLAIGDLTNDGIPELLLATAGTAPARPPRSGAGVVYGFTGGAGFFNGTTQVVTTNPTFEIWGADASDHFAGGGHNGMFIGDVTGDGIGDMVVSAQRADGPGNAFAECGEVYVIRGGPMSGVIDVRSSTLVVSDISGGAAGDRLQVIAVADMTGDGIKDIVIGVPGYDGDFAEQGAVAIIAGGPSLPSSLQLSPANATAFITGINGMDQLGYEGAVGDLNDDGRADIVVAAATHDPHGNASAGAAWALFGPLTGVHRLADGADVTWYGRAVNDELGSHVLIGNFAGSTSRDVILGAKGASRSPPLGAHSGTVDIWTGPFTSGRVFDLSAGGDTNEPQVRVLGSDDLDQLGFNMEAADLNHDGVDDLVLNAAQGAGAGNLRNQAGEVSVVFGEWCTHPTIDLALGAPLAIYGNEIRAHLGVRSGSIEMADIDLDGHLDLCVAAYSGGTNGTFTQPGRVDCIRGRW